LGHAIINLQAITALAFLLLFLVRLKGNAASETEIRVPSIVAAAGIALVTVVIFWRCLTLPFIHDTCSLVYIASQQSWTDITRLFVPPAATADFFFRPLAFTAFWVYAKWAHLQPLPWNALCLAIHIANSLLVFVLARQLSFGKLGSATAALVFALHGTRAEAVAWPAVRVDLLATFFVLLTLLEVNRLVTNRQRWWYAAIVVTAVMALLSKEAAYGLPLIAWAILLLRRKGREVAVIGVLAAVCLLCFAYRWWVLGGIGGYGAERGDPAFLHGGLLRLVNGLCYRMWAFLFFPINWSERPSVLLWCGIAAMIAALLGLIIFWPVGDRRVLLAALLLTVVAALPAHQFLFSGADLSGTRVLYLPVLGLALFWGGVIQGQGTAPRQLVIATALLLFQGTALTHNLRIWSSTSLLAQKSYRYIAAQYLTGRRPIAVENLPSTFKGVFFLQNAFTACVLLNSDGTLQDIPDIRQLADGASVAAYPQAYRWNERTLQFDRVK
jgi:hypothetical protein